MPTFRRKRFVEPQASLKAWTCADGGSPMGHPAGTSSHRHALVVLLQLPHVLLPLLYPPLEALLCGFRNHLGLWWRLSHHGHLQECLKGRHRLCLRRVFHRVEEERALVGVCGFEGERALVLGLPASRWLCTIAITATSGTFFPASVMRLIHISR